MLAFFKGQFPDISKKAYIAEGAAVIGMVKMGDYSSIWYNVTVRGDVNRIEIGQYSNIQDNSCLHVADKYACIVKDYVTVGHGAILHACTVEDYCLIGMGAIVLDGAVIGRGSIVAAGSVVTKGTIVPPNSLVIGTPGKVVKTLPPEHIADLEAQALKYKSLWAEWYNLMPDNDGKRYTGHKIV